MISVNYYCRYFITTKVVGAKIVYVGKTKKVVVDLDVIFLRLYK